MRNREKHYAIVAALFVVFGGALASAQEPASVCTWSVNATDADVQFDLQYEGYTGTIRVLPTVSTSSLSAPYQWRVRAPSGEWTVGGGTASPEETVARLCYEMVREHQSSNPEPGVDPEQYSQEEAVQDILAVLQKAHE